MSERLDGPAALQLTLFEELGPLDATVQRGIIEGQGIPGDAERGNDG